jgi:hypothetical protein
MPLKCMAPHLVASNDVVLLTTMMIEIDTHARCLAYQHSLVFTSFKENALQDVYLKETFNASINMKETQKKILCTN